MYDARSGARQPFDLPGDLRKIDSILPLYPESPRAGSMVLVAYTVSSYHSKKYPDDTSVSLNILWAAVLHGRTRDKKPSGKSVVFLCAFHRLLTQHFYNCR